MKATDIVGKNILEFIMSDISITLSRLGVHDKFEDLKFDEDKYLGKGIYKLSIPDIRITPMIFKKLSLVATIHIQPGDDDDKYNYVNVNLRFVWNTFSNGLNGTEIGNVKYEVYKNIPEPVQQKDLGYYYVKKVQSLEI